MVRSWLAFGPALIAGVGKLASKAWDALKNIFGPSKAELAAREMFAGFHAGAVAELGKTQQFADEVQVAINAGWDRTLAETRAGFIIMGTDMGKTYDEAFADYGRYEKAVRDGNTSLMAQIEAEYAEWQRLSAETAEKNTAASAASTETIVHDAAEIGRQFKGLTVDEAAKLGAALLDLGNKANQGFSLIHSSAIATGNALGNNLLPQISAVSSALMSMPKNITITITKRVVTTESAAASSAVSSSGDMSERDAFLQNNPGDEQRWEAMHRQHGGPVSAGRPYMVGERGPELFVPRSSGSVVANKDQQRPVVIRNILPIDDIAEEVIRRTADTEARIGFDG